jgi:hypothetical protein
VFPVVTPTRESLSSSGLSPCIKPSRCSIATSKMVSHRFLYLLGFPPLLKLLYWIPTSRHPPSPTASLPTSSLTKQAIKGTKSSLDRNPTHSYYQSLLSALETCWQWAKSPPPTALHLQVEPHCLITLCSTIVRFCPSELPTPERRWAVPLSPPPSVWWTGGMWTYSWSTGLRTRCTLFFNWKINWKFS